MVIGKVGAPQKSARGPARDHVTHGHRKRKEAVFFDGLRGFLPTTIRDHV